MMNFKQTFKKIFFFSFLLSILFFPLLSMAAGFDPSKFIYEPMEEIPGFEKPGIYADYIVAVYNFGLWTIGISAILMISIGAFMYISSAANVNSATKAKGIIFDAIAGLLLAMLSYLIIYTINPNLLKINLPGVLSGGFAGGTGAAPLGQDDTSTGGGSTSKGYQAACPNPTSTAGINFSLASGDTKIIPDTKCNDYDAMFNTHGATYGVDPKLLKAIAQIESSCGRNKGPSAYNACGLMQILPSTANSTCDKLMSDDNFSIETAAKFIKENLATSCVLAAGDAQAQNAAILGGYNSGYGCGNQACSTKLHALCPSKDCPGKLAFQCCKNPGGLGESISYAWNGIGLMSKL